MKQVMVSYPDLFLFFTKEGMLTMKKVAIVMGSDSDYKVVEKAIKRLKDLNIETTVHVMSAHRTPERAGAFAKSTKENGYGVLIAAAGMAAHLAGVLAAYTTLPVIGLPVSATNLDGLDALLATVQMPSGVPVATVAINGADNAALLAAQILALSDETLAGKLIQMKADMAKTVEEKDEAMAKKVTETFGGK